MIFNSTPIEGVAIIELAAHTDDRGFFARSFDRAEFVAAGLDPHVEQANISFNHTAGTLRGMHCQVSPHPETKLVRCTRGAIVDTIVDMRWGSPTRLQHVSVELTADNHRALYVPAYFAHGYQTLVDDTEVTYMVSGAYAPGAERGLRHDDPSLGLSWPLPVADISPKDAAWPLVSEWSDDDAAAISGRPAVIIIDTALAARESEGRPIGVALVGAGFMGRGLINQIVNSVPGMRVSVVVNRTLAKAEAALREAGVVDVRVVTDAAGVDAAVAAGAVAITDDFRAATGADTVDALVEATGAVEYGCHVVVDAIAQGKDVVLMNAELDGTVGPILSKRAKAAGVVLTGCDGDQPGVEMNLVRFVRGLGLRPLVCGNIKGLQDEYRTPTTQAAFAEKWGQDPYMVTSFADGTKVSFEQAIVANATGMTVERRGMRGADHHGHVDELTSAYDVEELERLGGVVDYVVGAKPGPGVFVLATHDDPKQRHYLNLYKLGEGPLYSFYTPYHLCHFEVPNTVARAVLFRDVALEPLGAPTVEVVTVAKADLPAGTIIDGLGGYSTYGVAERADTTASDRLLPIGLAEGCRTVRDIAKDEVLTYDDVELPVGRLVDRLREEQATELPVMQVA